MRILPLFAGMLLMTMAVPARAGDKVIENVVLGIHGGIGYGKNEVTPEFLKQTRAGLEAALKAGAAKLKDGGTSIDAVETAIRVMEDDPNFNAGKGAVFTHEGRNELDASIMDGRTKKAGAVAGVTIIRNPISAARTVMEKSKHVLFTGRGAEVFASQQDLEIVDPAYFWTEPRWKAIQEIWAREKAESNRPAKNSEKYGTVGAVALDGDGNLAAGTSTGGMTNKMAGRIGDSPIIGAGTYADNEAAAISCTGHGEFFIRYAVSHEIVAQMKYRKIPLKEAAEDVINKQLRDAGGEGGCVALDHAGNFATAFNTEGMYRGCITRDGKITIRLYED